MPVNFFRVLFRGAGSLGRIEALDPPPEMGFVGRFDLRGFAAGLGRLRFLDTGLLNPPPIVDSLFSGGPLRGIT